VAILDFFIVNVAIPDIRSRLGAAGSQMTAAAIIIQQLFEGGDPNTVLNLIRPEQKLVW